MVARGRGGGGFRGAVTAARARRGLTLLAALLALAVQTSLFAGLDLGGIRPDLVLVVVVAYALASGAWEGALLGLAAGFLVDLYGGRLIGVGTLAKAAAGALAGFLGEKAFREHALVHAAAIFVSSLGSNGVYLVLARAFGLDWPLGWGIGRVILSGALYDALAGIVLYPLLARAYRAGNRLDDRILPSAEGG
ncbi:MAG: rod shape-determining protein MreD [Firmicutes bacterium]|nr:rod shape-determining protein MreD [Bacillota bacterium]MBO2522177.1 rod shape-determining protein MreD [Bacillota bacterium]